MADRQTQAPQSIPAALMDKLMGLKARPVNVDKMAKISLLMIKNEITKLEHEGQMAGNDLEKGMIDEAEFERKRTELIGEMNVLVDKFRDLQDKRESLPIR